MQKILYTLGLLITLIGIQCPMRAQNSSTSPERVRFQTALAPGELITVMVRTVDNKEKFYLSGTEEIGPFNSGDRVTTRLSGSVFSVHGKTLQTVSAHGNQLTSCVVVSAPSLTNLNVMVNELSEEAISRMIASLPQSNSAQEPAQLRLRSIADYDAGAERNMITKQHIKDIKGKGWIPLQFNPDYIFFWEEIEDGNWNNTEQIQSATPLFSHDAVNNLVSIYGLAPHTSLHIYDMQGRIVHSGKTDQSGCASVNLPKGNYLFRCAQCVQRLSF